MSLPSPEPSSPAAVVRSARSRASLRAPIGPGSGRTALLYPSLARAGADFDALAAALCAAGHAVLTVDPLARDATVSPEVRFADFVDDLVALLDAAGVRVVDAVGHAFGSRIVRLLSILRPERVRSVVCLACGGRVERAADVTTALLGSFDLRLPDAERISHVQRAFFAPGNDAACWLAGWFPAIGRAEVRATVNTPETEYFAGGPQPLLILQGADDLTAPPENARLLAAERTRLGRRTRVVLLPRAGHALLPEQPDAIARHVLAALQDAPATP